jgi:hypothetical protein
VVWNHLRHIQAGGDAFPFEEGFRVARPVKFAQTKGHTTGRPLWVEKYRHAIGTTAVFQP